MARRRFTAVLLLGASLVLAGCGGGTVNTQQTAYETAHEQNTVFREATAGLLVQLADEEWRVDRYGDYPMLCEGGYRFELGRYVPGVAADGWRIPGGAEQHRAAVAAWMEANGFTGVRGISFEDQDALVLEGENLAAGIAEVTVRFFPGEVMDGISLQAVSVCFPGDAVALADEMFPNATVSSTGVTYPATETPDATPVFGDTPAS